MRASPRAKISDSQAGAAIALCEAVLVFAFFEAFLFATLAGGR